MSNVSRSHVQEFLLWRASHSTAVRQPASISAFHLDSSQQPHSVVVVVAAIYESVGKLGIWNEHVSTE